MSTSPLQLSHSALSAQREAAPASHQVKVKVTHTHTHTKIFDMKLTLFVVVLFCFIPLLHHEGHKGHEGHKDIYAYLHFSAFLTIIHHYSLLSLLFTIIT